MSVIDELEGNGNWLFKNRSLLPILILPLLFYELSTPLNNVNKNILLYVGIGITCFGEFIRILTVGYAPSGTSGRNTKQQLAVSLNTKGIYSVVRHPLYLGNLFMFSGPFIFTGNGFLTFKIGKIKISSLACGSRIK